MLDDKKAKNLTDAIEDYQGNIRMVVRKNNKVQETTHYYPYGGLIGNISSTSSKLPMKYGGKELDRYAGLDLYDFHARQYDAKLGSFNSIDPLADNTPSISPYAYCAGDPVNLIDPDGRKVIMINGFSPSFAEHGEPWYWKKSYVANWANQLKENSSQEILYRDGSIGSKVFNYGSVSMVCQNRVNKGAKRGEKDAADLIDNLKRDENGNVIEPLIVITHSMGAAYAKGYLSSVMRYAKDKGIEGLEVYEFDFAPHQPTEQKAVDGVYTYQISHSKDDIVNNPRYRSTQGEIQGAVQINSRDDSDQSHTIYSFSSSVQWLKQLFNGLINK